MSGVGIGITIAFAAGFLSFLSPCVLPLIPSYATFLTGMSIDELRQGDANRRVAQRAILVHGCLFVLGFSLVFIALGASASALGGVLSYYSRWVQRIGGLLLILFGSLLLGVLNVSAAAREYRFHFATRPAGYVGTVLVGVAFGAGWTPCIGPVLGGILTLAATQEGAARGVVLLAGYSAGLAIPFLAATLAIDQFLTRFRQIRRWLPWLQRVSGAVMVAVGLLLLTGSFTLLSGIFARWTPRFLLERL